MKVTGWKNGRFADGKSVTLGIRIGRPNAEKYFDRTWTHVFVELDGATVCVGVPGRFWHDCPELRHHAIGDWMRTSGLVPWKRGRPPKLNLVPAGGNKFRLTP